MTALVDKKAERGGPGPKGRKPKRAMPGTRSPGVISRSGLPFHTPCHREGIPHPILSSRGRSPWRSTVSREANRTLRTRPLHAVDCRVLHFVLSSQ